MKFHLILWLFLVSVSACHDTITVIKGCCEDPPVVEKIGNATIYVPNVFTPNGDGVFDRLVIYGDSVRQILHMEIRNKEGVIVYDNYNLPVNDHDTAWDGQFGGNIVRGMYSFEMKVEASNRIVKLIKGKVCNCPCDQEADEDFVPIRNCEFAPYDTSINHQPVENLPCFEN